MSFLHSDTPDFHIQRRKEILKKYPEVRKLMGSNSKSIFWITLIIILQTSCAIFISDQPVWIIIAAAFFVGAFFNHALYVFVHETAHNLIFRSDFKSRLVGLACDLCLVFPGSQAFRKFHLMHHLNMGDYGKDADLASDFEARIVGNKTFRKLLWVIFLGVSQALRPMRFENAKAVDTWSVINLITNLAFALILYYFAGIGAIAYLFLSTFLALGLHPLGGRWIAEHYLIDKNQETYSYYGPLNTLMFNIGHHTEHHDFMNIPWINLSKLKKIAPEYYNSLRQHKSYTGILYRFVMDPEMDLYSRISRD